MPSIYTKSVIFINGLNVFLVIFFLFKRVGGLRLNSSILMSTQAIRGWQHTKTPLGVSGAYAPDAEPTTGVKTARGGLSIKPRPHSQRTLSHRGRLKPLKRRRSQEGDFSSLNSQHTQALLAIRGRGRRRGMGTPSPPTFVAQDGHILSSKSMCCARRASVSCVARTARTTHKAHMAFIAP